MRRTTPGVPPGFTPSPLPPPRIAGLPDSMLETPPGHEDATWEWESRTVVPKIEIEPVPGFHGFGYGRDPNCPICWKG